MIPKGVEADVLRILVLDDEKQYAEMIAARVHAALQTLGVEHTIDTRTDSADFLGSASVYDMAFLDVEMQPISGIEVARKLQDANARVLLFMVTSFNQYLDDAMDLRVFRYLQKPLNEARLAAGLEKALEQIRQTTVDVYLTEREETVRIRTDDILYIEIIDRKTKVVTSSASYVTNTSLRAWQTMLPKAFFYPVHVSFLVNVRAVRRYKRDCVTMQNGDEVPVAYRKQAAFRKFFLAFCGK